jgi:hypothetical protein
MKYKKLKLADGSTIDAHRFIMEQHLGRKLTFNEIVHHIDEDKTNNALDNLEIMTRAEHSRLHMIHSWNADREKRLSTLSRLPRNRGSDAPSAKLTREEVIEIRRVLAQSTESLRALGHRYGVAKIAISRIRDGITYNEPEYYPGIS